MESKFRAERAAWEIAKKHDRTNDLECINPGGIFGPLLDEDPGTTGMLLARMMDGSLPATARISLIVVDVRDVAALHVLAMTQSEAGGRRFPTGAGSMSMFPTYAKKLPRYEVPNWVVRIFAFLDADARDNLGELGYDRRTDAVEARALLGRPFVTPEAAIVETARSAVEHGIV